MLVKLRKITSKAEALVASTILLHSDKKFTFAKDEGIPFYYETMQTFSFVGAFVDSLTIQNG